MTGCPVCDWHGPDDDNTLAGQLVAVSRELHRATHELGRLVAPSVEGLAMPVASWAVDVAQRVNDLQLFVGTPAAGGPLEVRVPTKGGELGRQHIDVPGGYIELHRGRVTEAQAQAIRDRMGRDR